MRRDQRTRAARAVGRDPRAELLDAALRVFARRGLRAAGVDEIAEEAGYSKGALYWHFAGKEALLLALIEERVDAPTRELVAAAAGAPPERDMSLVVADALLRRLAEDRDALLLAREYWSLALRDGELRERYIARQADLHAALSAALEARARHLGAPITKAGARAAARLALGAVDALVADALLDPGSVTRAAISESFAIIAAGVGARSPRR
ncbi:MAG: hypothetical protein QOF76_1092 [Solirubrobacteraceae bacterium]|jgi:AcrR family transcriptional regulator|nr:hypothetical protein [Solirubrobacteraceae bacterium]